MPWTGLAKATSLGLAIVELLRLAVPQAPRQSLHFKPLDQKSLCLRLVHLTIALAAAGHRSVMCPLQRLWRKKSGPLWFVDGKINKQRIADRTLTYILGLMLESFDPFSSGFQFGYVGVGLFSHG